jgi:putative MATE family efflux protein
MVFGIFGMVAFNLADLIFVGQLGKVELAALSYTFPVILTIGGIIVGVGAGISSVISRKIGEGKEEEVSAIGTHGLILGLAMSLLFAVAGHLTMIPLFESFGALPGIVELIDQYMSIWYTGCVFVIIPMISNSILRGTGNTTVPALVILTGAALNIILDPILIFGWGPVPAMGIRGAAYASILSRVVTFLLSIYVLKFRVNLVSLKLNLKKIGYSWKKILFIGIPNSGTMIIIPLGMGVIMSMLEPFGPEAAAGYGIASRIEFLALIVISALSSVLGPFIGQNLGAGNFSRVREGYKKGEVFSFLNGLVFSLALALLAYPIARFFTDSDQVVEFTVLYLRIVPFSYAFQGIYLISVASLNVMKKPFHASGLGAVEMFGLNIPLVFLGSRIFGLNGVFPALALSYVITGILSHLTVRRSMEKFRKPEKYPLSIVSEVE